jgi:hypothetical protein
MKRELLVRFVEVVEAVRRLAEGINWPATASSISIVSNDSS